MIRRAWESALATLRARRGELVLVATLVLFSAVTHAWNMFGFPYYENDEATYASRAWAFVTTGQLDVYTYRYDHAPAGWMLLGGWFGLTGGPALFGSLLASGRVLMLLVHLVNTVLVYGIAKRMSLGSVGAGAIAALVFAASPLGLYFQRRILLDNLMVLWLLLAIWLLLARRLSLHLVILSGIVFGLAVLTKMNAAFFGLGFLVLLWARSRPGYRIHSFAQWLAFAGSTVLLFVIYAALNQELFPAPLGDDGMPERVSLVDTFALQLGRGDFAWPWDPASSFQQNVASWLLKDTLTLVLGAIAVLLVTVVAIRDRRRNALPLALVVFVGSYLLFLVRGGIVIDLYVAPLLPLLAIAIGVAIGAFLQRMPRPVARPAAAVAAGVGVLAAFATAAPTRQYTVDETTNQLAAIDWVDANVDPASVIAADNYVYPGLAIEDDFDKTLYFFNAEYDPEARELYADDWRNIDYLVVTHELIRQVKQGIVPEMRAALDHAELRADFTTGTSSFLDFDAYISTNGDWARVYEIKQRNDIVLQDAWQHYRDAFVVSYGQVVDRIRGGGATTTSTDQSLALDQALLHDDEATFRGIWQWTTDHLRHRQNDELVSWNWRTASGAPDAEGVGSLGSPDTVCGTDLRFIHLLYRAADTWSAPDLAADADVMAADWWAECTFEWEGMRLVDSSADGSDDDQLVNPSFFDPGALRSLAVHDPTHDWTAVVDGGYRLLDRLLAERGTVPDWTVATLAGRLGDATSVIGPGANRLGEDTLRLVPALIRDELAGEERATGVLDALTPLVMEYASNNPGRPAAVTATMLSQVRDTGADAEELYADGIAADYDRERGAWGDGTSLADHNWAWSWHRLQADLPAALRIPLR